MSNFIRKTILFGCRSVRISLPTSNLGFVGNPNVFFSLRLFSSGSNQQSFTVSYLMNKLKFSPEAALSVSKHVNFESAEKPDRVINLFKKYGFSQTQISSLLRRNPCLLVFDAEKCISLKLEFFDVKGVSWPQFAKKLSQFPTILRRSLDKQIVPSYEFLRNFLQSDEKVIATVNCYPDIINRDTEKCLGRNISNLREHGVPNSNIAKLILRQPSAFSASSDRFRKIVEEVVEKGFNEEKGHFVEAVRVLCGMSKSTWKSKVSAYKKWGWSEEEVLKAFRIYPLCMFLSEHKITAAMDFFTNKMGLSPGFIANRPLILSLSLKKRVIPRFSVFQALLIKGLVKKEISTYKLLETSEKKFLQNFVMPYKEAAPELLKLYEGMDLSNGPEVDEKVCKEVT